MIFVKKKKKVDGKKYSPSICFSSNSQILINNSVNNDVLRLLAKIFCQ